MDLRWAWRYLSSDLRFTTVAVLSLALGIAASTSIFTFVHAILLAPLPFPDSDRIVVIAETDNGRATSGSPQRYRDWLRAPSVERVAAYYGEDMSVRLGEAPERIIGLRTFGDPLETLNIQPFLGRGFTAAEKSGAGPRVAVITESLWRAKFGGNASAIGTKISLNGEPCEIVGVLPTGVQFDDAEIISPEPVQNLPRSARFLMQLARLRPGADLRTLNAELVGVAARLRQEYPATDTNVAATAISLRDHMGSPVRLPLLMLLGAVGFVLLIAAVNIAGLAVSRIASRRREIAIRMALGAARLRIASMVLAECGLLAIAGGVLGGLASVWGIDFLKTVAADDLPRVREIHMNPAIAAFGFAITALAALIAGLVPAWSASSEDVNGALRKGGRNVSRSNGTQASLAVVQIAVSVVLLVGGGLLFRSLWTLEHRPLGFAPQRMLTFRLSLPWQTQPKEVVARYERVLDGLREIAGVRDAALTDRLPLGGPTVNAEPDVEGMEPSRFSGLQLGQRAVSVNYLKVMGVPILAGRRLDDSDVAVKRTVVNDSAARQLFAGENPIGRRIGLRWRTAKGPVIDRFEIVGVVADLPEYAQARKGSPAMYVAFQHSFWPAATFVVQSSLPPDSLAGVVRQVVARVDSQHAIEAVRPLDEFVGSRTRTERLQAWLVGSFAGIATLLAAIGIYGLAARRAVERRREMAIRIALGATPGDVIQSSVRFAALLAMCGGAAGALAASAAVRLIRTSLYGVEPLDWPTYGAAVLILVAVAVFASWRPAVRSTKVQPIEALQAE